MLKTLGASPDNGRGRKGRRGRLAVYVAIGAVSVVVFGLLAWNDTLDLFYEYSRAHEEWQLDELLWLFFVGSFALLGVLLVHGRQLAEEVAARQQAETAVKELSRFDEITGIPNRRMFLESLEQHIRLAGTNDVRVALLVIDVDQFMAINDRLGLAGGDHILWSIAARLRAVLSPQEVLARLGSDEFAVIFPLGPEAQVDDIFRLAQRILTTLHQPFPTMLGKTALTVSIGIAKFPRDASDEQELLRHAEIALSQAKAAGRNRYALFDSSLDAQRRERVELEAQLKAGLQAGEIVAFYQPLVRLSSREPVGAEALARWRHPTRGLLGPGMFMDMAQDAGLMGQLFEQMLERVCQDTRTWPQDLTIAVNISPQQLMDCTLADSVFAILDKYGYPAERLEIEITETALLLDFDAARQTMGALKARGVRLSLDDFGTGYSSLTHLHQLPFDKLKIDRSFVQGVLSDSHSRKIVSSMIGLGKALGLTIVAEGVEHETEAEWLRAKGCDLAQGFVFARPMPAEEVAHLMGGAALPRSLTDVGNGV